MHAGGGQLFLITTPDDGLDSADMYVVKDAALAADPFPRCLSAEVSSTLNFLLHSGPLSSLSNADVSFSRADRPDMKLFVRRRQITPLTELYKQVRVGCPPC